jgi:hypothetical protein
MYRQRFFLGLALAWQLLRLTAPSTEASVRQLLHEPAGCLEQDVPAAAVALALGCRLADALHELRFSLQLALLRLFL